MISWGTIKSLLIFFGPILLPKAIQYYRSAKSSPAITGKPIQPTPPAVGRALAILFGVAIVALASTLPFFAPENLFSITQSRLQIPTDVLFTRLSAIRPHGLTEMDNILRQKLVSMESRLLYLQYGPSTIANCLFCNSENSNNYLYYAIPGIVMPHLFNLSILALVTSGLFVGKEGAVWRSFATIGAVALAGLELWLVSSYNYQANARATRIQDIDKFFWTMRIYRGVAIAALDGITGWFMWLAATNRAFVVPLTTAERVEMTTRVIEATRSKINAMGVVRNTVIRDDNLRNRSQAYWVHEGKVMGEVMEDREVVEGVNNALENRIDIGRISHDANTYAGNVIDGLQIQGQDKKNM